MSIGTDTVRGKEISETESTLILPSSWCKPDTGTCPQSLSRYL